MVKIYLILGILFVVLVGGCSSMYSQYDYEPDYECSYNAYNCDDFTTEAQAQAVYRYCGMTTDIHHLDGDSDGRACEALP